MAGIGLFVFLFGYASLYWANQAIQGNAQPPYLTYLIPFAR